MDENEHEKFKAFQAEFGAESAFLVFPDKTLTAFVRVFHVYTMRVCNLRTAWQAGAKRPATPAAGYDALGLCLMRVTHGPG